MIGLELRTGKIEGDRQKHMMKWVLLQQQILEMISHHPLRRQQPCSVYNSIRTSLNGNNF